jgi:hypothetical protein
LIEVLLALKFGYVVLLKRLFADYAVITVFKTCLSKRCSFVEGFYTEN